MEWWLCIPELNTLFLNWLTDFDVDITHSRPSLYTYNNKNYLKVFHFVFSMGKVYVLPYRPKEVSHSSGIHVAIYCNCIIYVYKYIRIV